MQLPFKLHSCGLLSNLSYNSSGSLELNFHVDGLGEGSFTGIIHESHDIKC